MAAPSTLSAFSVCIYCSSSEHVDKRFVDVAADVGRGIAARGWAMVYGGGGIGLMGAIAHAALAGGAHVTGVIPHLLADRELALLEVSELIRTTTMRERKQIMDDRADAFLVLPGGIGTLEELVEIVSLRQLGYHDRPIVVLDAEGFWDPLREQVERMERHGMLHAPREELWSYANTATEALDLIDRRSSGAVDRPRRSTAGERGPR